MSGKVYFNFIINEAARTYTISETRNKPQSKRLALDSLRKIERIMQQGFRNTGKADPKGMIWTLEEEALRIKNQFMIKADGVFWKRICGVAAKKQAVNEAYNRVSRACAFARAKLNGPAQASPQIASKPQEKMDLSLNWGSQPFFTSSLQKTDAKPSIASISKTLSPVKSQAAVIVQAPVYDAFEAELDLPDYIFSPVSKAPVRTPFPQWPSSPIPQVRLENDLDFIPYHQAASVPSLQGKKTIEQAARYVNMRYDGNCALNAVLDQAKHIKQLPAQFPATRERLREVVGDYIFENARKESAPESLLPDQVVASLRDARQKELREEADIFIDVSFLLPNGAQKTISKSAIRALLDRPVDKELTQNERMEVLQYYAYYIQRDKIWADEPFFHILHQIYPSLQIAIVREEKWLNKGQPTIFSTFPGGLQRLDENACLYLFYENGHYQSVRREFIGQLQNRFA